MGMFEQSMILAPDAGKKTGALVVSLTAQTTLVGAALLLPLLYNDRLPTFRWIIPLNAPLTSPPPIPEARATSVSQAAAISVGRAPRPFRMPIRATTATASPVAIDIDAPVVGGDAVVSIPATVPLGTTQPFRVEAPAPRAPDIPKTPSRPISVGGDVQAAKLIRKVVPTYPSLAKIAHVSGTVRLTGIIAKDGTIQQLRVVAGHPLLVPAALDAVRQWVYRPTTLNGETVEVIAPIDVIFTLAQ
jgi:protein TonB